MRDPHGRTNHYDRMPLREFPDQLVRCKLKTKFYISRASITELTAGLRTRGKIAVKWHERKRPTHPTYRR